MSSISSNSIKTKLEDLTTDIRYILSCWKDEAAQMKHYFAGPQIQFMVDMYSANLFHVNITWVHNTDLKTIRVNNINEIVNVIDEYAKDEYDYRKHKLVDLTDLDFLIKAVIIRDIDTVKNLITNTDRDTLELALDFTDDQEMIQLLEQKLK